MTRPSIYFNNAISMEKPLEFRVVAHRTPEYDETVALRDAILRRPLGIVFAPDQLATEGSDHHLAAYRDGELVACLVLTPREEGAIKMRQVAVSDAEQGTGIGRALVVESERLARALGFERIVLNARAHVVGFYEKLGYTVVGEPFEEVGIPHRAMSKVL